MNEEIDRNPPPILPTPAALALQTGKWIGLKWGPLGLLVTFIISAFSGISYLLWNANAAQQAEFTKERKEDKAVIIAMTQTVTKTLADTADSNDKLSQSIDRHSKAIDELQRTIERRNP